ncbi:hypothetical protein Q7P37_009241 [Cladosporium fusiforme]
MIGTSVTDYVFIRTSIFVLNWIAPFSVIYCILTTIHGSSTLRVQPAIELWLTAEALFCICFFLPYRRYLQQLTDHPPLRPKEERRKLVDRIKAEVSDPEHYIRGWFKGADIEDIGRQDLKKWITWAFFDCDLEEGKYDEEIEEYALEFESMIRKDFQPGNGTAKPLRLTIDPVDMLHRSLLWYLYVGIVDFLAYMRLEMLGFHFHRLSYTSFFTLFPFRLYQPHTSTTRLPILFIHSIGIGLYPYIDFLFDINSATSDNAENDDGHIGVLAVEIMPISFRITHSMLDKDELCMELCQIVAKNSYDRFVLVSHSYGSVISKFILADEVLRPKAASALFVDPVNFLLHTPDVAYNFTVRQPRRANEWQLWYFASKDPGVAHALGQRFFWSQKVMWKNDVDNLIRDGKRLTVSLAGKDLIVNYEAVKRYLVYSGTNQAGGYDNHKDEESLSSSSAENSWRPKEWSGNGLEVLCFEQLDHGQAFDKAITRARLVRAVRNASPQKTRNPNKSTNVISDSAPHSNAHVATMKSGLRYMPMKWSGSATTL